MSLKQIWRLLKETFKEWNDDNASRLAAALSYYTIFSLAPLLIIAIAIAGAVFGDEAASGEIVKQIQGLVGKAGAEGNSNGAAKCSKARYAQFRFNYQYRGFVIWCE